MVFISAKTDNLHCWRGRIARSPTAERREAEARRGSWSTVNGDSCCPFGYRIIHDHLQAVMIGAGVPHQVTHIMTI